MAGGVRAMEPMVSGLSESTRAVDCHPQSAEGCCGDHTVAGPTQFLQEGVTTKAGRVKGEVARRGGRRAYWAEGNDGGSIGMMEVLAVGNGGRRWLSGQGQGSVVSNILLACLSLTIHCFCCPGLFIAHPFTLKSVLVWAANLWAPAMSGISIKDH